MKNLDTILRGATLLVLMTILYILLPLPQRYEYRIANTYGMGVFNVQHNEEPISISGTNMVVRRRKW